MRKLCNYVGGFAVLAVYLMALFAFQMASED